MPQEGQSSYTLTDSQTVAMRKWAFDRDLPFSRVIKWCIWLQFGTKEEKIKAKKCLGIIGETFEK